MIRHHFTSPDPMHLGLIVETQRIVTTESSIQIDGSGPRVVWLTSDPTRGKHQGWTAGLPKDVIRFDIDLDDAQPWRAWAIRHGSPRQWMRTLERTGGNGAHWYIVQRPITWSEITNVNVLTRDGTVDFPPDALPNIQWKAA